MGNKENTGPFYGISPVQQDRKRVEHEVFFDSKNEMIFTLELNDVHMYVYKVYGINKVQ